MYIVPYSPPPGGGGGNFFKSLGKIFKLYRWEKKKGRERRKRDEKQREKKKGRKRYNSFSR